MNEVIEYLAEVLGLDIKNHLILSDINAELSNIDDLGKFVVYVRQNFNGSQMAYKNGFQKFLILVKNYKDEKAQVDTRQLEKVSRFSNDLHKKVCDIFDKIHWEIQSQARDIDKYKLDKMFSSKELQVLVKIGKRQRLLTLVVHHKNELLELIYKAVRDLTIEKNSGAVALENNGEDVIKKLENKEK